MLLMKDLLPFPDEVGFSASLRTMSRRPLRNGEPGGQVYALKRRMRRDVQYPVRYTREASNTLTTQKCASLTLPSLTALMDSRLEESFR